MQNKVLKTICLILSYVLVATTAVCVTLWVVANQLPGGSNKLDQLANLLVQRFVDGADKTELEDRPDQKLLPRFRKEKK